MKVNENLSPAWEAALHHYALWMRRDGKQQSTIRLRIAHLRSVARLSRTCEPGFLTRDHMRFFYAEGWTPGYLRTVLESVSDFYDWWSQARAWD